MAGEEFQVARAFIESVAACRYSDSLRTPRSADQNGGGTHYIAKRQVSPKKSAERG